MDCRRMSAICANSHSAVGSDVGGEDRGAPRSLFGDSGLMLAFQDGFELGEMRRGTGPGHRSSPVIDVRGP
jgi:hypothetical protein